jgi:16S rRNA (adenine1518-N6/adenine1519-N6)-dimethyltransferase
MKLSEMKKILVERELRLTKSLGQNFMHDANQLRRIVRAADLKKSDKVLEVGPGLGPLTELLLEQAGQVLAIEKDIRLVVILRERFPVLHLIHGDALDYLDRKEDDWSDWKLVANLPYSIASRILVELAQGERGPQRMVVTLQIEVAKRLMAKPGEEYHGLLTLLVQVDYEPQGWFKISASCFFPEPDVDSACVSLVRRDPPLLAPDLRETFAKIVKRSFSQRRKKMLKLLREDWPARQLDETFERLQLSAKVRAETVSLEEFVRLAQSLARDSRREGDYV